MDAAVREIQSAEFPNAGYRRVQPQLFLFLFGIRTPQLRVRESLQITDTDGVAMRWVSITQKAVYYVSGPLALWHTDGNHKNDKVVVTVIQIVMRLHKRDIAIQFENSGRREGQNFISSVNELYNT